MENRLDPPVHLYVKKHRVTGLRYFGRTTEDPRYYRGSGVYWTKHLDEYGDNVDTYVVGTYRDRRVLTADAERFSTRNDIVRSTEWANLLPEDGGVAGAGWTEGLDFSTQIQELDRAVKARLAGTQAGTTRTEPRPQPGAEFWPPSPGLIIGVAAVVIAIVYFNMWLDVQP